MASRPRSARHRGWPDGLYERGGYYSWRNPITGKELGIGRVTLGEAKAQAAEANVHIAGLRDKPRLVDRLAGREDNSLGGLAGRVREEAGPGAQRGATTGRRQLADNTVKTYRSQVKKIREVWNEQLPLPLPRITTRMIADGLKRLKATVPPHRAGVRSRLHALLRLGHR
jgi:hypothetical protein